MIVFDGNRALMSAQFLRTNVQARGPWRRLAMHSRSRNGAFWVLTSPLERELAGPVDQLGAVELGQRIEVAELILRCRRRTEPGEHPLVVGLAAGRGDDARGGRHQLGIDRTRFGFRSVVQLAAPRLRGGVVAEHRERAGEQPAELADQVALVRRRFAEIGERRRDEQRDALLQPRERGVVEEPSQPAQADDDRLPHGVLALVGEPFEERQQVGRRQVTGDDRVPGVVDEVVALERVERARARRPSDGRAASSS